MNSRLATQLAKAVAGSRAFVCVGMRLPVGLPQAPGHRDCEDSSRPGDSRV